MPRRRTEPQDDRTPAAWARETLAIARRVHPAYERNREVRLPHVELIRPLESGLLVSQSFVRLNDTYSLCFALLFTRRRWPVLVTPLMSGARLDSGHHVARQLLDDLDLHHARAEPERRPPPGVWSSSAWRSNTLAQLERGLALPEELLLPHHERALREGAARLVRLFSRAEAFVPALLDARARLERVAPSERSRNLIAARFRLDPRRLDDGSRDVARTLDAVEAVGADPAAVLALRGRRISAREVARGACDDVGDDAVIAAALDAFAREVERLPELTAIARRLGA